VARPRLLLYLTASGDRQRLAVGPALAAAAERAGWGFELYHAELRRGRHFGSADPAAAEPGVANGGLVAGGRHADRLLWLATHWDLVALGAAGHPLWPSVEAVGATVLARSTRPATLYAAAFEALGQATPSAVAVVDGSPQGPEGIVVAPYLYPALLGGAPALLAESACLALDVSSDADVCYEIERLGAQRFLPLGVDGERAGAFPKGLDGRDPVNRSRGYAQLTAELAELASDWARGVLIGDPDLVASQLPKARRLRLMPLHGRPQVDVIAAADGLVRRSRDPVFGRQYDDRDFFALAQRGHGLQVVDPGPPFDAAYAVKAGIVPALAPPAAVAEPADAELERWADEGRVLSTLLLWCGMLRELDALERLVDLVAETGVRAGLVVTAETVEHAGGSALGLLGVPRDQGGVSGQLELLLASTGRGVAAEAEMPAGTLTATLAEATAAVAARLPEGLRPRGWWPLLDTPLVAHRPAPAGLRDGRPIVRFSPRGDTPGGEPGPAHDGGDAKPRDVRARLGGAVRRAGLDRFVEARRPFDDRRPGPIDARVAEAVRSAGFSYMLTKAAFGQPAVALREGDFVALPFTAGGWDGWSPFYTVGGVRDLARAERRLRATGRPGWLMSTVDSPLWALSGEIWEHGSRLHAATALTASGGRSGELVNVTPNVVARYARLLDDRRRREPSAAREHPAR